MKRYDDDDYYYYYLFIIVIFSRLNRAHTKKMAQRTLPFLPACVYVIKKRKRRK